MRLTLAGSTDGALLLVDDHGTEYHLSVDHRLRAALRGETSRLGQLEIEMDSVLRPRDIQARIRAGETPEAVAAIAQTSVEKIMPYAGPVLAERQHVAERAQRSSVRRRPGSPEAQSAPRVLGDAVAAHLRAQQVAPDSVEWDAWRREDGRWTLTAGFATIKRTGTAQFGFDLPGNFVVVENDDARWLIGDQLEEAPAPRNDLEDARLRRLATARSSDDELPLGDDALGLLEEADSHPIETLLDAPSAPRIEEPAAPAAEPPAEPAAETQAEAPAAPAAEHVVQERSEPVVEEPAEEPTPVRRPAKNRRGRASVPSWDEIMFGGGKQE
ncbi:septation protein SepH [Nocardioides fonticola]|uniref:Septation protein SepH n=1 Tax=Nocardioides fonticola TaxID=450363 RepID=A0ABP7Y0D4_9ACTN